MNTLKQLLIEANLDDLEDLPDEEEDDNSPEHDFEDLPNEEDDNSSDDDLEDDSTDSDEDSMGDLEDLPEEDLNDEDDAELDTVALTATDDPDKQGLIRNVNGAHLVYKRSEADGTYEELWAYKCGDNMQDSLKIRKAIISGTDIPPTSTSSPDGKQTYSTWAAGNCEMLQIKGLEN
jgi:hypothetical protein